jgi:hypothetical protein
VELRTSFIHVPQGVLLCLLLWVGTTTPAGAQTGSAGALTGFVQVGWNARVAGSPSGDLPITPVGDSTAHSFQLVQARIYLQGKVDERCGYTVRTNLAGGFNLLTAFLWWQLRDDLLIQAGQMLKPVGRDRTRSRHLLLSLDRSVSSFRLLKTLNYGHFDVGVLARITLPHHDLLNIGLFNGQGTEPARDTDTGKNLVIRYSRLFGALEVGGGVSLLQSSSLPPGGRRNLCWGVDALWTDGRRTLECEILLADDWRHFDPVDVRTPTASGAVLTGVLPVKPPAGLQAAELVLRLEKFRPGTSAGGPETIWLIPTLNLWLNPATRLQAGVVHERPAAGGEQPATSAVLLMQVNFF